MVFHRLSKARRGQHLFAHLSVLGLLGLTLILAACGGSSSTNSSTGQGHRPQQRVHRRVS